MKARWPEVMLVVILQAAMMLLMEEIVSDSENMDSNAALIPFWASFLLGVGMVLCGVLWQMLYLGFLKTAAISGSQPQQPVKLLRSGRPYFWKILFFQMMLGFVLFFLNIAIVISLSHLLWQDPELDQLPQWFAQICAFAGILIVLKPMLLVPARMIVYDDTVYQAIFQMRRYILSGIDHIFKVLFLGLGVVALFTFPIEFFNQKGQSYYILTALRHVVFSFLLLSLTLIAVLWVQEQFDAESAKTTKEGSYA